MSITVQQAKEARNSLERLLAKVIEPNPDHGICRYLELTTGLTQREASNLVNISAVGWKHYSGNPIYPITYVIPEDEAFDLLPLWEGVYGERRRKLCMRIYAKCTEIIHKAEKQPVGG